MNITITSLSLTNFKCFRSKVFTFSPGITTIQGRNGAGKTTIADAILFCLFGKNTAGQSDLELFKTRENGKVIPNLDHSVELVLSVSVPQKQPKIVTLRRSIKEVWVKKRGSEESVFKNNTCEYFVNGEAYTQADFKKYIDSIVSEDVFRSITNPTYFLSLNWKLQREFLEKMVGSIAPEEVVDTDELAHLVMNLEDSNEDIVSYRKHLSYQIKQIKDKLDRIPVRLEEQNKALPERLDWDALNVQYADAIRQQNELEDRIVAVKTDNGSDVLREEIRKEIRAIRADMELIEAEQRAILRSKQDEHDTAVNAARQQFNQLVATQRDLEQTIPSFDALKKRCQETLDQCERDAQAIRDEWTKNLSRRLQFSESDCVCPTCGQYLPEEQVAEKRQKAEANLNADKARVKADLTARADKVKETRAEAEKMIAEYDQKRAEAEKNLSDVKEQINQAFSEKQKLEKTQLQTLDDILKENVQYVALSKQLSEAQDKLNSVGTNKEVDSLLAELLAKKEEYQSLAVELNSQLASRTQYDRISALIEGIETEQRDLIKQLSDLEREEDIASQYQEKLNAVLEQDVNQRFRFVQWRMFRTVNNGGDAFEEPYCECLVDGIPYGGGLNQAARLNAGLDVITTLCAHYDVSAPIIIDNAESNLNILPTAGQQIRLQVFDSNLQIV